MNLTIGEVLTKYKSCIFLTFTYCIYDIIIRDTDRLHDVIIRNNKNMDELWLTDFDPNSFSVDLDMTNGNENPIKISSSTLDHILNSINQ